jgi:1-aminocyclopropane-1-carboxylate deaminase/D-cysteine desulfhydrase-like pyridoxal-dependent ACC family enzyme
MKTAACEPLGGNKVRKLELVAAEAVAARADPFVTVTASKRISAA